MRGGPSSCLRPHPAPHSHARSHTPKHVTHTLEHTHTVRGMRTHNTPTLPASHGAPKDTPLPSEASVPAPQFLHRPLRSSQEWWQPGGLRAHRRALHTPPSETTHLGSHRWRQRRTVVIPRGLGPTLLQKGQTLPTGSGW